MRPLLILRPRPGADATLRRAIALGLDAIAAPIFELRAFAWGPPDPAGCDGVLMTCAIAARFGGEALAGYRHLPLFAVGAATAAAARSARFITLIEGAGDGMAAVETAVAQGKTRLLHLAGREHIDLSHPQASIDRRIVYASDAVDVLPDAARQALRNRAVVLLHSARAAKLFGGLIDAEGLDRRRIAVAALSEAVRIAVGGGWEAVAAAPAPDDQALLAIAAGLCDQGANAGALPEVGEDRA